MADRAVLQCYLDAKHNTKQCKLRTLTHCGYFLSATGQHVFGSVIGATNNVLNEWSWETNKSLVGKLKKVEISTRFVISA